MPSKPPTLLQLRRYAVARSLFTPVTLPRALERMGFVQADPIRAPARAQDLILRHRAKGYSAGDLERRYPQLAVEEDFFVNYGFVTPALQALMHPRPVNTAWTPEQHAMARALVDYVAQQGEAHPRTVDAHFAHGRTTNWFGGNSRISTQLLDDLHYRGLLRIARRESGTRVYALPRRALNQAPAEPPAHAALDTLVDALVALYAPLPLPSLRQLLALLRGGVPHWREQMGAAFERAQERLPGATVEGMAWVWPADENPASTRWQAPEQVRLLAPFDPVVWDRRRFSLFWQWDYRFEAYTPPAKRVRGYYALPLLWQDEVIGWCNASVADGQFQTDIGYVSGAAPKGKAYGGALEEELAAFARFLGVADGTS